MVRSAPLLYPYGADQEAIVWDSSMRFSERTFIRMMTRIMQIVFANGLPTTGKKAEVWNHPLITWD
jgi:hypothetical protein